VSTQRRDSGQASVELVAALPVLLLSVLVAAQLAVAGYALWSAAIAARAGSRSVAIGAEAAPAVRRALPPVLRRGSRISERHGVEVRVRVPRLLPIAPRLTVGAASRLSAEAGNG
jgi:hypothetical protein